MMIAQVNRQRRLGIEVEFYLPRVSTAEASDTQNVLSNVLTANGLKSLSRPYSHQPFPDPSYLLAVESDSSIRPNWVWNDLQYSPIEIKSNVINFSQFEEIFPKTLALINELSGKVNHTTGLHCHIDLPEANERPRIVQSLYHLFVRYQNVLYSICPPSRQSCGYALPIVYNPQLFANCKTPSDYKNRLSHWERRTALNLTHLFGTNSHIEIRFAASTLNYEKLKHWLLLCLQMVQHAVDRNCRAAEPLPPNRLSLERFMTCCGLKSNSNIYARVSPELRETGRWALSRFYTFQGKISLRSEKDKAKKKESMFPPPTVE